MDSEQEEWRMIPSLNGRYEASNHGRIRSTTAVRGGPHVLSDFDRVHGYRGVTLCINGLAHREYVHRLVAEAFHGPCPAGKNVNHRDLDKSNNTPSNLEYTTPKENIAHSMANGRYPVGGSHNQYTKKRRASPPAFVTKMHPKPKK